MRSPRAFVHFVRAALLVMLLAPGSAKAQSNDGTTWGYWLVGGSLVLGTTSVLLGLDIDCSRDDFGCQRKASVLIWGGVGFASIGTLAGLTLVQASERRRVSPLSQTAAYTLTIAPRVSKAFSPEERQAELVFTLHTPY